tara:strand:- start:13331 stop:13594 length:264 start_codon:yes stop_codon:yes gene_type:complete
MNVDFSFKSSLGKILKSPHLVFHFSLDVIYFFPQKEVNWSHGKDGNTFVSFKRSTRWLWFCFRIIKIHVRKQSGLLKFDESEARKLI